MANEPRVSFAGRLGGDPEARFLKNGTAVVTASCATTPRLKKDDEWQDGETIWFRLTWWGKDGETAVELLHKGDLVTVQGDLSQRTYETDAGEKRSNYEVTVREWGVKPKVQPKVKDSSADPWS